MTSLAIRSFLTMFVVLDPVGLVPMFLGLVGPRVVPDRRLVARRAVVVAGAILFSFAIGGSWLLERLGITVHAFRVAGGLLLFGIAVRMVFGEHERETPEEEAEARSRADVSVFPLAIPIIAGPGAMASVMMLVGEAHGDALAILVVLAVLLVVLALCYAALRAADRLGRILGQTGANVVTRILGVILAALAVQYMADGVRGFLT